MKNHVKEAVMKHLEKVICGIIVAVAVITIFTLNHNMIPKAETAQASSGIVLGNTIPERDGQRGLASSPFVILEVVPDYAFAEIGYLIAGSEPIDMTKALEDEDVREILGEVKIGTLIDSTLQYKMVLTDEEKNSGLWKHIQVSKPVNNDPEVPNEEEDPEDPEDPEEPEDPDEPEDEDVEGTHKFKGYFKRVARGTGDFVQVVTRDDDDNIISVVYRKEPGRSVSNYEWVDMTDDEFEKEAVLPTDHNAENTGDRIYFEGYVAYDYFVCDDGFSFTNNDLFKKNVLGLKGDEIKNYHITVKTITPSELNTADGQKWIARADLFYLNNAQHNANLLDAYKQYNVFNKTTTVQESDAFKYFEGNEDLSWDSVMAIFNRIVLDRDFASIMIDSSIYRNVAHSYWSSSAVNTFQLSASGRAYSNQVGVAGYAPERGCTNNVYKLCLMLKSMDPTSFYNHFMNANNGGTKRITNSENTGRLTVNVFADVSTTASAVEYIDQWNRYTFMPAEPPSGSYDTKVTNVQNWIDGKSFEAYLNNPIFDNPESTVAGRIYSNNQGANLLTQFEDSMITKTSYSKEFFEEIERWDDKSPSPANAIKYILAYEGDKINQKQKITVLEVQPYNQFSLTIQTIRSWIPRFMGEIELRQMISPEFVCRIEDLNGTYDMIYFGTNINAAPNQQTSYNGNYVNQGTTPYYDDTTYGRKLPKYNDTNLDGKVYLHVGDRLILQTTANTYPQMTFGRFLPNYYDERNNYYGSRNWWEEEGLETRMPGNDINTRIYNGLVDYVKAGYPIIADAPIYNCGTGDGLSMRMMDSTSHIYKFFSAYRTEASILNWNDANVVSELVTFLARRKPEIIMETPPPRYNHNPSTTTNAAAPDSNYLDGRKLEFKFSVTDGVDDGERYEVALYVDINADGKFSDNELVRTFSAYADKKVRTFTRELNEDYTGCVPWKLEVYKATEPAYRTSVQGISAIKNTNKPTIKVLQVRPNGPFTADLKENRNFQDWAASLNDFTINITVKPYWMFESYYSRHNIPNRRFDRNNPVATSQLLTDWDNVVAGKPNSYDMVIFGFGDAPPNVSNAEGGLDDLFYYINCGYSVILTHDLTGSVFKNITSDLRINENTPELWGYNFGKRMRDVLGMDRFGVKAADSYMNLDSKYRDVAWALEGSNSPYTRIDEQGRRVYTGIQGFTYFCALRAGDASKEHGDNQYKYYNFTAEQGGIYIANQVERVNEGQITQYPYSLPRVIDVAGTHFQYLQLNPEDPDLVVWYTLAGGPQYGAIPRDGLNNYYIYNRGNITYSGAGHSDWGAQHDEIKLFINTMVAAYSNAISPPRIVVDTKKTKNSRMESDTEYSIRNYDFDSGESEDIRIYFIPEESNLLSENMRMERSYILEPDESGNLVPKYLDVYDENDKLIQPDSDGLLRVKTGRTYYVDYPKENLNTLTMDDKVVYFTLYNDKGMRGDLTVKIINKTIFNLT